MTDSNGKGILHNHKKVWKQNLIQEKNMQKEVNFGTNINSAACVLRCGQVFCWNEMAYTLFKLPQFSRLCEDYFMENNGEQQHKYMLPNTIL